MDFFNKTGPMAIGSRLRMLADKITDDAAQIYQLYDIALKPKWFPVFFVLSNENTKTITALAKEIGHSHPSVSNIIKEMSDKGLVQEDKDQSDGRKNLITLTLQGKSIAKKLIFQYADVTTAINHITQTTQYDLWKAIEEWEFMLSSQSLLKRVEEQKKIRESQNVQIILYDDSYKSIFKALNEEWINGYFEMEEADHYALDHPQENIIQQGGYIFVALYKNKPVGVCALLKNNDSSYDYDYELAKMAVSPNCQGKNIGFLLGSAALKMARTVGANKLYLESNTILTPAINLYHKLGFKKVVGQVTPYKRCNIQMALILD